MSHLQQFYVNVDDVGNESFVIRDSEAAHAIRVLRKKVGEELVAVDGLGMRYSGPIVEINPNSLRVAIARREQNVGEPSLNLVLAQAVPRGPHFDWVVEKGTEVGISAFQPILTERSIIDPTSRIERWKKKALAAMKQCGRSKCPQVLQPMLFAEYLRSIPADACAFLAHESLPASADGDLAALLKKSSQAILFVGPEGGFTPEEFQMAIDKKVLPIRLGPRRLRSETAGLVGAVKLFAAAGDLE